MQCSEVRVPVDFDWGNVSNGRTYGMRSWTLHSNRTLEVYLILPVYRGDSDTSEYGRVR